MAKYKVHEYFNAEFRMQIKEEIKAIAKTQKLTPEQDKKEKENFQKRAERASFWRRRGINPLETSFIGPFTIDELMEGVGLNLDDYTEDKKIKILEEFENAGIALSLAGKKDEKGLTTIDLPEDEMDKKDELSLWDKICAFFGIQTEHAHKVEMEQATAEAVKDKQKELNDKLIKKQMQEKRRDVLGATGTDLRGVAMANEKADAWRKIFFPNESPENKVSDYTMDNGKKVSSLSLCMAVLQQTTRNDLSSMSPDEFKKMMAEDEKLQKRVEKIGNTIKDMAQKSNVKKLKYVDQMLGGDNGLSELDDKLKKILKPGEKAKKFDILAANDFNNMEYHAENDRNELFSTAAIMFKLKDDMAKIFGKNDEIYGMQDNLEAAKMEQHVKMKFKTAALRDAFEKENYDKALKIAGYGNDYSKLEEVTDLAVNMGTQLHNEFMSSINKAENTIEDIEYDMGNEL